ncbi:MAG: Crp/Fnr family transcriptional regulator [Hydrogenophilales bacterium]|nr:Crp/Fnr family transcriptional regulator [Hydrogenophilales bacterium]
MRVLQTTQAQRLETIGRLRYFEHWNAQQVAAIAATANILAVDKGHELVTRGKPLNSLYLVITGEFRFFVPIPGGQARSLGLVGEGRSFGEACVELAINCPYSGVATTNSHVLAIEGTAFKHEVHKSTRLLSQLLALVANRLMSVMNDLETCAQHSSLQRVACYLGQFQPPGDASSYAVPIEGRKKDIATRIGLTPETFSRVLTTLEQNGTLSSKGKVITVLDAARLRQIYLNGCEPGY